VFPFALPIRVRFAETDAMGIVHHAAYLPYLEAARVEYLRQIGHPYAALREVDGVDFVVVGVRLDYHRPALFDEELVVRTGLASLSKARFTMRYAIERAAESIATGETRHAVIDRESGRPARVPAWMGDVPLVG
jgi:acyl-CoA thioester hydrolase